MKPVERTSFKKRLSDKAQIVEKALTGGPHCLSYTEILHKNLVVSLQGRHVSPVDRLLSLVLDTNVTEIFYDADDDAQDDGW